MLRKLFLGLSCVFLIGLVVGLLGSKVTVWQPSAIGVSVCLAIGIGGIPMLKGYQYTAWIVTAVVAGMVYPNAFLQVGGIDLRNKWLILVIIQLVMFGMGIQMRLKDFSNPGSTGKGVLIGMLCQFSIMPLLGYMLTRILDFEPEIAAGIILAGSCSSGLASNVMTYLARANLVLSVTVTAIATLLAPLMTPFWMKMLAGTLIEIQFISMMMEIIKIVLVPIGAALLHDYLKTASGKGKTKIGVVTVAALALLLSFTMGLWHWLEIRLDTPVMQSIETLGFFAGAVVVGVIYHLFTLYFRKLDKTMPYISMFGIIYFTTVTTAAGRDHLLQVGMLLVMASIIHNSLGYLFGYWISRILGLDESSSRTMALEVGMQNCGMASGLAGTMGKLGTVGLAAAVFSPWMNISGSILANYWRRKSLKEENEMKKTALTS